jgi:sec-independent protein translocase protein TatA
MFDIGGPEALLILFIFLLLFGANKMPELARGIGKSIKEFKKAASSVEDEVRRAMEEEPKPANRAGPKPAGTIEQQAGAPKPLPPPPPAAD